MIDLFVMVSGPRMQALSTAGQAAPPVQTARGLIDTGASCTCVDPMIFTALGLQPTGMGTMLTPSTGPVPQDTETYDVGILIPNGQETPLIFPTLAVSASGLRQQSQQRNDIGLFQDLGILRPSRPSTTSIGTDRPA